jgi:outer membrane protein OmpA-like peptidoglycan-associated protein
MQEKAMNQSVALISADDMARELGAKGRVALYINFDVDKATLRDDGMPVVAEIDKLLRAQPDLKLAIEGHTDNSGNAQHNKDLSRQRAETVLDRLVAGGIDKARLSAAGYGAEKPLADNGSEEGRAKNRRVELVKR